MSRPRRSIDELNDDPQWAAQALCELLCYPKVKYLLDVPHCRSLNEYLLPADWKFLVDCVRKSNKFVTGGDLEFSYYELQHLFAIVNAYYQRKRPLHPEYWKTQYRRDLSEAYFAGTITKRDAIWSMQDGDSTWNLHNIMKEDPDPEVEEKYERYFGKPTEPRAPSSGDMDKRISMFVDAAMDEHSSCLAQYAVE